MNWKIEEGGIMEKKLTKSDLFWIFMRSNLQQASFNFERIHALGFCFDMVPAIKRLYHDKAEQAAALKRHLNFFNVTPACAGPVLGHGGHAGSGRGYGGIEIVDAEQHRLQDAGLRETALHGQHRRPREVGFTLRVTPDVAVETVVGQPLRQVVADDSLIQQELQGGGIETEFVDGLQSPSEARDHPVAAALRQTTGEHVEQGTPARGARVHGGLNHRQLVVVGQQCCRHGPSVVARRRRPADGVECVGRPRGVSVRWQACVLDLFHRIPVPSRSRPTARWRCWNPRWKPRRKLG